MQFGFPETAGASWSRTDCRNELALIAERYRKHRLFVNWRAGRVASRRDLGRRRARHRRERSEMRGHVGWKDHVELWTKFNPRYQNGKQRLCEFQASRLRRWTRNRRLSPVNLLLEQSVFTQSQTDMSCLLELVA